MSKKCRRTLILMMGGGLYDNRLKCQLRGLRTIKLETSTMNSKEQIQIDTRRWKKDLKFMKRHFEKCASEKNPVKYFKIVVPVAKPIMEPNLKVIREFFNQHAKHFILIWFGHGDEKTGDWCFEENSQISAEELIKMWKLGLGYRESKHLIIISDTCYSGKWIEYFENTPEIFKSKSEFGEVRLSIQCGSRKNEKSFIDNDIPFPSSLLMKKMFFPKRFWAVNMQHPTFFISPKAMRYSRHKNVNDDVHVAEEIVSVQPFFNFVRVNKEWLFEKNKRELTMLNDGKSLIILVSQKSKLESEVIF